MLAYHVLQSLLLYHTVMIEPVDDYTRTDQKSVLLPSIFGNTILKTAQSAS